MAPVGSSLGCVALVMVSLYRHSTVTKIEVGTRDAGTAVAGLTLVLVGKMWTLD